MAKLMAAADAIETAKKNALSRRKRVSNALRIRAQQAVEQMIDDGVVHCSLFLTDEEYQWGSETIDAELTALGYKVSYTEEKDEHSNPDMEISIEHLK